jgi:predicted alpha/beta superfamily hydrolase
VLHLLPDVAGPADATRDVLVATPPGYDDATRHYPVAYLLDGQNLFDPATSYAGDWDLLETLEARGQRDPVILVGIPNLGHERLREYSPFDDPVRGPGEGEAFLAWLIETVKPMIDARFRTRPERGHTAIGGSSMGGLFALWALLAGAATFGAAWSLSPALWYADGELFRWLAHRPGPVGRIYLDSGELEGDEELFDARRMRDLLLDRGWVLGVNFRYVEDPDGEHNEASWGRRMRQGWRELTGMVR